MKSGGEVVAIGILVVGIVLFVAPAITHLLWNWAVVPWLGVPTITYWQAFGVVLLWELFTFRPKSKN